MAKEETKVEVKAASNSYKEFEALIEAYKKSNPRKYELKKAELERKLAALK
jgi:hypothetical protein